MREIKEAALEIGFKTMIKINTKELVREIGDRRGVYVIGFVPKAARGAS